MTRLIKLLSFYLLLSITLPAQATVTVCQNEPDSVYLFSYASLKDEGKSGLKFAWSIDNNQWFNIADGFGYVKCDFGRWGTQKRMFRPHLEQNSINGIWHCTWAVSQSGEAWAYTTSPNLLNWKPQTYFSTEKSNDYKCPNVFPTYETRVTINGTKENGWVQRVPYSMIEQLVRFAEQKKYRQLQNSERTEQDAVRFAGLQPIEAVIEVKTDERKPISNHLIGVFFEDINYAADGGLYAELIQNRDFEYSVKDGDFRNFNAAYAWTVLKENVPSAVTIATENPIHVNNPHYAVLEVKQPGTMLQNEGFDGIALKKGKKYDLSLFTRIAPGGKGSKVTVRLLDKKGQEVARSFVNVSSQKWKKQKTILTANADVDAAVLSLQPESAGTFHFDMISLFPQDTFKGRKNGLRADLAQTLADLRPRFIRFPGGCVAHGDGVDNIYDWKGSIGPLEARKPLRNLWGYHQTRGLGYHEYFQFCEDINAEPVPVLAAGVPCQNSATCSRHSTGEISCSGQQGGIPLEEMPAYIQDILDLIEYANGDARKTVWGRKRAEAGHPQPFNMKYIGIGNEDMITEVFKERFAMIFKAVKEKYPEITVIGTVGPFYEGTDYDEGWRLATELNIPIVDEHYYVDPGWMIHNQDYYDRYDRKKSKVYLGEYAAHLPGRPNNIETALAEALYLTSVERNADVVAMTSYAPLLAKEGHTQWSPDLIYFNNTEVKPTVGYYTQQMYGQNAGTEYITSHVVLNNNRDAVTKRIGVSVVKDDVTGDYIIKLVNMLPVEVDSEVRMNGISFSNPTAVKTLLTGDPKDKAAKSVSSDFKIAGNTFPYLMPAYSFTVIRIHQ